MSQSFDNNNIDISVDLDALIEFYGEEAPYWANLSIDPLDVIEFCSFKTPEWKTGLSKVTEIRENQEYTFRFSIINTKYALEAPTILPTVIFKMLYTQKEDTFSTLEKVFSDEEHSISFNGQIAEVSIHHLDTEGEAAPPLPTWQATLKTKSQLPKKPAVIRYAITFSFKHNDIMRYCQIDPLIRTRSGN